MTSTTRARSRWMAIVVLALLWSFLMPTIETVVTPVSSAIPAVSSTGAALTSTSLVGQNLEKAPPIVMTAFLLYLIPLLRATQEVRRSRLAFPVPLLMKSRLLSPVKFMSNYLSV